MANKTTKTVAELQESREEQIVRHAKRMAKLSITVGSALAASFPDMVKDDKGKAMLSRIRAICLSATDAEFKPAKRESGSAVDPLA